MDDRLKKLNDKIVGLRTAYDQVEKTAEEMLALASKAYGGGEAFLEHLVSFMGDKDAPMEVRLDSALAQFGVLRLMLNESEREHAEIFPDMDPRDLHDEGPTPEADRR